MRRLYDVSPIGWDAGGLGGPDADARDGFVYRAGMDAIETIMTTRAIRRFTDQPVSDADIETCLKAAQQAPSGGNVQPQQYVVLTDPDRKAELARWYRRAFDRYEATLATPTEFRDDAGRRSWERTRDASRHLADHLHEVPAIVVVLQALICQGPIVSARRRSVDLPIGGHQNCPLMASGSAR